MHPARPSPHRDSSYESSRSGSTDEKEGDRIATHVTDGVIIFLVLTLLGTLALSGAYEIKNHSLFENKCTYILQGVALASSATALVLFTALKIRTYLFLRKFNPEREKLKLEKIENKPNLIKIGLTAFAVILTLGLILCTTLSNDQVKDFWANRKTELSAIAGLLIMASTLANLILALDHRHLSRIQKI